MNMGNYGYFGPQPHAITRVDNTDYLKASVSRRFYVGAGVNYASYAAPDYDARRNSSFSGNTYSEIAPTFIAGVDFMFPCFSRFFMAQMELGYTPHRYDFVEYTRQVVESETGS